MTANIESYLALARKKTAEGFTPKGAAMTLMIPYRELCQAVINELGLLGSSSDPYLIELQRIFP